MSSFPAKRIAVAERRFGDVADVPQLPLPEELSAYCKGSTLHLVPSDDGDDDGADAAAADAAAADAAAADADAAADVMLPPLPPLHTVTRTELDPHAERMRQGISRCVSVQIYNSKPVTFRSEQRHVEQAIIDLSQSETLEANKVRLLLPFSQSHVTPTPHSEP